MKSNCVTEKRIRILFGSAVLLAAILLAVSCAGAESLFSLTATPTPEPAATPAPTPVFTQAEPATGLFGQLATATPAPAAAPSPSPEATPETAQDPEPQDETAETGSARNPARGLSYSDMSGKDADRVYEDTEGHTIQYIFEQVTGDQFTQYGDFLDSKGCTAAQMKTASEHTFAYSITRPEDSFSFIIAYRQDKRILTLVFTDTGEEAGAETAGANDDTTGETDRETKSNPAEPEKEHAAEVCSHCNKGYCRECHGAGFFKCGYCRGGGGCPTCHGRRGTRTPGYGGVGTSTFEPCGDCGGNGRCRECGGSGKEDCTECDHGICRYCHGNYVLD